MTPSLLYMGLSNVKNSIVTWYGVATISRLLKITSLFCRIRLFYRAVLQKRPIILRSLLIVATPYKSIVTVHGTLKRFRTLKRSMTPSLLYIWGWLRLVGSLKLQVSVAEYSLFYRALLQKRPIISRSLLIVATPQITLSQKVHSYCT